MKIKFDVTPTEFIIIKDILKKYLTKDCKAYVFGSRAKSSSLHGSDLDLALECKGKIEFKKLSKIKIDFEDSRLPYMVDVIDLQATKEYFKNMIEKEMIEFPLGKLERVPELRFKEFSGEWEEKRLKEVSKINPKTDKLPKQFIYIDLESVEKGILVKEDSICDKSAPSRAQRLLKRDDILFQMVRPYQRNNYFFNLNSDYVASTGYAQVRTEEISKFLYYYLHTDSFVNIVNAKCTGTSYPAINSTDLSNIKINLPKKPEQQKIASFLTKIDTKIEQLTKKAELQKQYKKGVMQKVFSGEIRFKKDDGSGFSEWEEKRLGTIFDYKNGGSFEKEVVKNGKYYLITLNSIDINGDLKQEHKTINITDNSLNKNDLIMVLSDIAHGNFLGLTAIIPEDSKYVLNQRMGALKLKKNSNMIFLRFLINYNQKYFKLHGQGSSQQNLSKNDILNFKINLPSLEEQNKIADFLSTLDKQIDSTKEQLAKTKKFKKGLLQKMFV